MERSSETSALFADIRTSFVQFPCYIVVLVMKPTVHMANIMTVSTVILLMSSFHSNYLNKLINSHKVWNILTLIIIIFILIIFFEFIFLGRNPVNWK